MKKMKRTLAFTVASMMVLLLLPVTALAVDLSTGTVSITGTVVVFDAKHGTKLCGTGNGNRSGA